MYIDNIKIKNFRNINEESVFLSSNLNILIGKNANGKTNFLESVYIPSNFNSFRTNKIDNLILNKNIKTVININYFTNKINSQVQFNLFKNKKEFYLNNKKINSYTDINFLYKTILYNPEDIYIIKGNPLLRRNLLDKSIFLINNDYLKEYKIFLNCLKQRNKFLKLNEKYDNIWDVNYIICSKKILDSRISFLLEINTIIENIKKYFGFKDKFIELKYLPILKNIENDFEKNFYLNKHKDEKYKFTTYGPHRDNPSFFIDEKDAASHCSQGQQKLLILLFKTALFHLFSSKNEMKPILIFDDITGDLDQNNKNTFIEYILGNAGQVFMTSTDYNLRNNNNFLNANFFEVQNGKFLNL